MATEMHSNNLLEHVKRHVLDQARSVFKSSRIIETYKVCLPETPTAERQSFMYDYDHVSDSLILLSKSDKNAMES